MLNKIWQFIKRLIQRLFGRPPQPSPTQENTPIRPTLTDAEYESKFMEILEGVNAGWSRGDVAGFLIAKRLKDSELTAWLRRFGENLLADSQGDNTSEDAVASVQELARRLVLLGRIHTGELGDVSGKIGQKILTRFPLPEIEDNGGEGSVIEAVFIGDGLGISGEGNLNDAEGDDDESK
ncbi:MAG: tetratricopeptide repeat protein [Microcoleus sp.]